MKKATPRINPGVFTQTAFSQPSTVNRQQSTVNSQPSTVNRQPSTANSYIIIVSSPC
ncbi:MAG: hypothetical protein WCF82_17460 [Microcoleus sp.]